MELENLKGRWINSKEETTGIREFTISVNRQAIVLDIEGATGGPLAGPWGSYEATCYGTLDHPNNFSGFQLTETIQNIDLVLAGNINKGLIIIALYGSPKSNNELSNFFIREFFYQTN